MLLKVKIKEYINKYDHVDIGDIYIVLAGELRDGVENVLIAPFYIKNKYIYLDYIDQPFSPSYFRLSSFDIIADEVSSSWKIDSVIIGGKSVTYKSFNEWFIDHYYIRANDSNLTNEDFKILVRYTKEYCDIYRRYIGCHINILEIKKLNNQLSSADVEYSERDPFGKLRKIFKGK